MQVPRVISTFICSMVVLFVVLLGTTDSFAQVRSSGNYQLQSDSINLGGGLSSSTNFQQESTVGEVATGRSTSTSFSLQAGYQQMQEVFLSLAGGTDVIMSPDLPGITGGIANGSTTFTVITDSPAGYQLTIQAENEPAMQRADGTSIADYAPVGVVPDFAFATSAGVAEFGYSPEGVDISDFFRNSAGNVCGTGSLDGALACWTGLATTSREIARSSGANHPAGATTTIQFQVGIGSGANVETGVYIATTTVTALPL